MTESHSHYNEENNRLLKVLNYIQPLVDIVYEYNPNYRNRALSLLLSYKSLIPCRIYQNDNDKHEIVVGIGWYRIANPSDEKIIEYAHISHLMYLLETQFSKISIETDDYQMRCMTATMFLCNLNHSKYIRLTKGKYEWPFSQAHFIDGKVINKIKQQTSKNDIFDLDSKIQNLTKYISYGII